jgi:hypothetical protein
MKTGDKILIGIVVGIVLLVVVALVVTLTRPEPTYQTEDTPEGVVHNYLLALQKQEYSRAYGYIYPRISNYPASLQEFIADIHDHSWTFRLDKDTNLSVISSTIRGIRASVSVRETSFRGGGLFESGQSSFTFHVDLRLDGSEWKIIDSSQYFLWDWIRD